MKRYIILLSIIILGFTFGDVQKELIVLQWNNIMTVENGVSVCKELNFENAGFPDSETNIPVYYQIYDLENGDQNYDFSIENAVFEEIKLCSEFEGVEKIGSEIEIITQKNQSNGNFKLHLQIGTLKKQGDKVFRLTKFELNQVAVENTNLQKSGKALKAAHVWKTSSVLKQGKWIKIGVTGKGIVKIPHSKLISLGFSDPTKVNVFGSGGTILSEDPGEINYDDLEQCAVWHDKNNGADCLFLYSPGTTEWKLDESKGVFKHTINDYTTKGFFYLTDNVGNSKIAEMLSPITETATNTITTFDAYQLYEKDVENVLPLGSGKKWYDGKAKSSSIKNFDFNLTNVETAEEVKVRVNAIARSYAASKMTVLLNQAEIGTLNFNRVNTGSQTASYANEQDAIFESTISDSQAKVTLKYFADRVDNSVDDNALVWLDFIEVNYRSKLKFENGAFFFRDINSVGEENVVSFSIDNAVAGYRILDVTDINNAKEVPVEISGNIAIAKRPADKLYEYVAFNPNGSFNEPEYLGEVANQNLHALSTPDFVIITHPNFINSANRLADFHRTYDEMGVEVVTSD